MLASSHCGIRIAAIVDKLAVTSCICHSCTQIEFPILFLPQRTLSGHVEFCPAEKESDRRVWGWIDCSTTQQITMQQLKVKQQWWGKKKKKLKKNLIKSLTKHIKAVRPYNQLWPNLDMTSVFLFSSYKIGLGGGESRKHNLLWDKQSDSRLFLSLCLTSDYLR